MVIFLSTKKNFSLFPFFALVMIFNLYCSSAIISFLFYEMKGPILRNKLIKLEHDKP